jgi:molybdate transport system regulatory protein
MAEDGIKRTPHKLRVRKPRRSTRHSEPGYEVVGRVWIEKDGELYMGWGRVLLLESIDRLGSIAQAARAMKLTYRNAWLWVESMNRLGPGPLVEKSYGGSGGGRSRLTEQGKKEIERYRGLRDELQDWLKEIR